MTPAKRGRPDDRFREISLDLRGRFVRGEWKPGERIPTRRQLHAEYDASPATVQQILDEFEADGFTRSDGRNGTFVAASPPYLTNVALVFADSPSKNRLWLALFREALKERSDGLKLSPRCGVNADGLTDHPDQLGLLDDIQRQRLLGVFFTSSPFLVERTPIVTALDIPRVAIMSPEAFDDIPKLGFDGESFKTKALAFLKAQGRTRIAVVGGPEIAEGDWLDQIAAHGLESGPHWMQGMDIIKTSPGANLARLLFHGRPEERPDGLVIADDNLVEDVTKGIAAAGVEFPRELSVIAHCNYPCVPPSSVPVTRLGYNARELLEAGLNALRAIRAGAAAVPFTAVKALFEKELT